MNRISVEYEQGLCPENSIMCGVDEAGRGPLVGRVYAAAVILGEKITSMPEFETLNDSKKLTEKKRNLLADIIKQNAVSYCVSYAEVEEIEKLNILGAAILAMNRAVSGLSVKADYALIDGNYTKGILIPCKNVVKGDSLCPSIAAASILAKTERDKYCIEYLDKNYPEYGFAAHKGYGTAAHYEAVKKHGLCPEHRKSFFKKYFEKHGEML